MNMENLNAPIEEDYTTIQIKLNPSNNNNQIEKDMKKKQTTKYALDLSNINITTTTRFGVAYIFDFMKPITTKHEF